MNVKFRIQATNIFDGVSTCHIVKLMAGDTVIAEETGVQSGETNMPNQQTLTELVLDKAHYNLTELRQKLTSRTS